jgi:cystathionine gamma-synthase
VAASRCAVRRDGLVHPGRGEPAALQVCERAQVFILGESLGGVESLIEHPARMTHASAVGSPLEVPVELVRLSVRIESSRTCWRT